MVSFVFFSRADVIFFFTFNYFTNCVWVQVNILALAICTREAYQSMKERGVDDGHIININRYLTHSSITSFYVWALTVLMFILWWSTLFSMGGHRMVPSADEHFYCATKYAVTALTEGLRQELRETKTHIRASVSPFYCI